MYLSTTFKFLVVALLSLALAGCTKKKCDDFTVKTKWYYPILMSTQDYWASIKSEAPKEIGTAGKIYIKDQYIFVSEPYRGIHVIDNSDPAAPKPLAFLNVMGNRDIAIKGDILYADSYSDLTVFNISDLHHISFVKRLPRVMTYPTDASGMIVGMTTGITADSMVIGYQVRDTTLLCNCAATPEYSGQVFNAGPSSSGPGATGKGGSMARFTITGNYLYTVNFSDLRAFDIANAADPVFKSSQTISTGIETIFPYGDYLFIGSQSAMFIYDLQNPASPNKRSAVTHFRACDPVVVEGNKAYVTIRNGTLCSGSLNELQVFDISNVDNPIKLSTTAMTNPFGLGIDNGKLFICEGAYGLRFLNAADVNKIVTTKLIEGPITYDVIPYEGQHRLLVSAQDGIYQYDYSEMANPKLLSKIVAPRPGTPN